MKPSNLLIIMADEFTSKALGCYGNPLVRTPNIDALAARGALFRSAYTNNPICMPARAAFATGRHTHETGYWDNVIAYDGRVPSWAHRLSAHGHDCVSIGKLHYVDAEAPTGFGEQIIPMHVHDGGDVHGLIRDPPPPRPQSRKLVETIGPGESEFTRYDRDIARRATHWIEAVAARRPDKPWVLFVSFICPHFPLTAPRDFFDLYRPADVPVPKPRPERIGALARWWHAFEQCYTYDRYFAGDRQRQQAVAAYLALCSFVDDLTGRVLAALDATGLAASTRVAFTSDHGDNLGARGLWAKSTMYEESAGIPLLMAGPDIPRGRVVETPVSLIDMYPTVLDCAGLAGDRGDGPGRSLLQEADETDDRQRSVFCEYHATAATTAQFMLRKGRHKYIHYVGHGAELFDLATDPEEQADLAGDPRHAGLLKSFEAELRAMVNPEQVDSQAKADQRRVVESLGGRASVLSMSVAYATPAPAPES